MQKGGAVYILTNKNKTVLYTGVTSDLISRMYEHRNKQHPNSFTARYNVDRLVYYEGFHSIEEAIIREKQIKSGSRKKKEALIYSTNPEWNDLYDEIKEW
ncbi:GIY-YIG nuclease family protein [Reichenbachiella versicolor]|uniref:GIY-YIG nuclease family protein n=1 Tax=Reichenbachiella versicolor TaxID=1821036 RepID=UPI000D6E42E7|nr:GIY-YIG nuclease family protein [Reichenbachiella versicolor]